jgi:hypothetical protein
MHATAGCHGIFADTEMLMGNDVDLRRDFVIDGA